MNLFLPSSDRIIGVGPFPLEAARSRLPLNKDHM
jgi:hypothetical protein